MAITEVTIPRPWRSMGDREIVVCSNTPTLYDGTGTRCTDISVGVTIRAGGKSLSRKLATYFHTIR